MAATNLVGKTLDEMAELLAGLGEPRFRAAQLYAGIYRRGLRDWALFTDLAKPLRSRLMECCTVEYPKTCAVFESSDGTRRHLLEVGRGERIESVFIPEPARDTVCISTQVGCAVGCLFCVTGRLRMRRNLTAGEIVGQILCLRLERSRALKRLNVVIMGMGEPLHNFDNIMKALRLMTDPQGMGLSPRLVTLSTAGIVPQLELLAREPVIPSLAVSLSATTDAVRDLLIPVNRQWNIAALLDACRRFPLERRRRITFEYVLIGGVNDSPEDARRLVGLLRGLQKKVNLIPLNADPWVPLTPPPEERVLEFQKILTDRHVTAYIRRPRGGDVSAACGMLAGRDYAQGDPVRLPPKPAAAGALEKLRRKG